MEMSNFRTAILFIALMMIIAIPVIIASCAPAPNGYQEPTVEVIRETVVVEQKGIEVEKSQLMMDSGIEDMTIFDDNSRGVVCYIFDNKMDCVKY
jgi:PBP1b-binding outer membrane lipoprotein LpoB